MVRTLPTFTPAQIQQEVLKDISGLQAEFADTPWLPELIPLLEKLHAIAGAGQIDGKALDALDQQMREVLGKHRLKGLEPYLWMIASLRKAE